jgi:hypothetical protein
MLCNSWVILNRETMTPVLEFFNPELVEKVNQEKYCVMTTLEWLQMFNRRVKESLH